MPRPSTAAMKSRPSSVERDDELPGSGCRTGSASAGRRSSAARSRSPVNGRILPRISSVRVSGVTCSCSSVPSSRSRTMAPAVNWMSVKVRMIAMQARDDEVRGPQVRVVPGPHAQVDRQRSRLPAGAPAGEHLDREAVGDPRRDRHRLRRRRRVRGVDDEQRLRRRSAVRVLAEVAIDDEADRRAAPSRSRGAARPARRRAPTTSKYSARRHPAPRARGSRTSAPRRAPPSSGA